MFEANLTIVSSRHYYHAGHSARGLPDLTFVTRNVSLTWHLKTDATLERWQSCLCEIF